MAFLDWQERYETGLAGYDAQHQTLFRLANRIHECLMKQATGSDLEIASVFAAFLEMTRAHVRTEDELMAWQQYAPAADHEKAHHQFIQYLESMADPSVVGQSLRERLQDVLVKFKAHFEDDDEQTFLVLLRRKHFPTAS